MIAALLFAAALSGTSPVVAQDAAAPAPAPAATETPEQAAFEAKADAFGQAIETMQQEMQTAVTAAGPDAEKRKADLDVIEARYQPQVDTFVSELLAFVESQAAALPAEQAQGMRAGIEAAMPQIRGVIPLVRAQIEGAAAATPPAP